MRLFLASCPNNFIRPCLVPPNGGHIQQKMDIYGHIVFVHMDIFHTTRPVIKLGKKAPRCPWFRQWLRQRRSPQRQQGPLIWTAWPGFAREHRHAVMALRTPRHRTLLDIVTKTVNRRESGRLATLRANDCEACHVLHVFSGVSHGIPD
jgi:hypothetical protein